MPPRQRTSNTKNKWIRKKRKDGVTKEKKIKVKKQTVLLVDVFLKCLLKHVFENIQINN